MKAPKWTKGEIKFLKQNFQKLGAAECAKRLGRPLRGTQVMASREGFTKAGNRIVWTDDDIMFLKNNFEKLTAQELADKLGKTRTIVRMKYKELGLSKMKLEFFTEEMLAFLLANYKTTGNVELAEIFQERWPKEKKWTKSHFSTKLRNLKLKRTQAEYEAIAARNTAKGGRSYTIDKNSACYTLPDNYVAQMIAGPRNSNRVAIQEELLKNPVLIRIKRSQILLNRQLKQSQL